MNTSIQVQKELKSIQVSVLCYKLEDKAPFTRYLIDIELKKDDKNLEDLENFKKRMLKEEGLDIKRKELGLGRCKLKVGYCQRLENNAGLGPFIKSWTNSQWKICLSKVMYYPKFMLTLKPEENERHSLFAKETTSRESKAVPQRKEEPTDAKEKKEIVSPENAKTRGKKRSGEEVSEDTKLWAQLKSEPDGEIKRSKRQSEGLADWKDKVKSSGKFEALDERNIRCSSCNVIFAVNKFNALNDLGKGHKNCEAAKTEESNINIKQENLLHFFKKK